jgi:hypothetical protein
LYKIVAHKFVLYKSFHTFAPAFKAKNWLKGRRDSIPALRRKAGREREKSGKISHFFGLEDKNSYL